MKQAFIVIDVQNDFCPPTANGGGALAVPDGDAVVAIINRLLPRFELVVLTQDWHPANHTSFAANHAEAKPFDVVNLPYGEQILWPTHCVQGSFGAEFHPDLHSEAAHLIIRKGFRPQIDSYSAFVENDHKTQTGLASYLHGLGVEKIVLAGLATDYCVKYSALDGLATGFAVSLISDACRAINLNDSYILAMREMTQAGVQFITSEK